MTLQEYNDIYKNPVLKSMIITSSGGVTITNTNIVSEQMSLESALCSEEVLRYGKCESACFKIRIADLNHDFTGEWLDVVQDLVTDQGKYLLAQDGKFLLTESGDRIVLEGYDGNDAEAQYGRFKVISDVPTNDRRWRDLTCYDAMRDIIQADVSSWYNGLRFPMTIKDFRDSFFDFMQISQVNTTLCNDSLVVAGGFSVNGTLSGKVVIEAICELNGVFGQIAADGKFKYVSLKDAQTLTLDYYVDGTGSYEDYVTENITGIKARGSADDIGTSVGTTGNVYIIDNNPLVYGLEGTQELISALGRLLDQIKYDSYRPFELTTYGNPMLPLGTKVTIASRNQTIVSYVLRKDLTGIQSLKDKLVATGKPKQEEQTNSLRSDLKRTQGRVHELVVDVNGLTSRVGATETNLQNNYSTTNQTQSMIQQSASGIMTQVSNTYVTQNTYNAEIQILQDQIDGRIEYFDGNVIPTLNNLPASSWTTAAMKDSHVGDLYRYHYTEDGIDKTDYYRFDKNTSTTPPTYSWVTLGESDVDEALRQAALANQKADAAQAQLDTLEQTVQDDYATKSEVSSSISQSASGIESRVSQTYETKADATTKQANLQSQITQNAEEIVLKVDSNGNIVKVALGATATGSAFQIKADNISFIANRAIDLTTNELSIDSTNFKVTKDGVITAVAGNIGGWEIGATTLSSLVTVDDTDYNVLLVPWRSGLQVTNNAFIVRSKLSSASSWNNQFSVAWNGKMVAKNAEVTGTITTNALTATGGHIGSFNINTASISSEYVSGNTRRISYWNANTGNAAQNCFVIRHTTDGGSSYTFPFVLRYDGRLTATDAHITGDITTGNLNATGGLIGAWHITANSLYSEYVNGNTQHRVTIRTNNGNADDGAIYTRTTTNGGSSYTYPTVINYDGTISTTKLSATGGTVGGWSMSTNLLHGGNSTTGIAAIQVPNGNIGTLANWTYVTGGSSSNYNSARFRVASNGNAYMNTCFVTDESGGTAATNFSNYTRIGHGSLSGYTNSTLMFYLDGDGGIYGKGDLLVRGTKSRIADTSDYGKRLLYCYETPTPMFGDLGEGKIAEDGKCYVWLDSTFSETIKTQNYQVFLQKYGQGECYVTERTERYFIVEGTPDMKFGWEIKARQSGFENMRLETYYGQDLNNQEESIDYAQEAIRHLEIIKDEREVA